MLAGKQQREAHRKALFQRPACDTGHETTERPDVLIVDTSAAPTSSCGTLSRTVVTSVDKRHRGRRTELPEKYRIKTRRAGESPGAGGESSRGVFRGAGLVAALEIIFVELVAQRTDADGQHFCGVRAIAFALLEGGQNVLFLHVVQGEELAVLVRGGRNPIA